MLIEKAHELENNNFRGLFNFIRYIEKMQKNGSDIGANLNAGENDDTVKIMTIHKSKGLEFPVVILCGCAGEFNKKDTSAPLLMHKDMGFACDYTTTPPLTQRFMGQFCVYLSTILKIVL